jgi:hypothetical protein
MRIVLQKTFGCFKVFSGHTSIIASGYDIEQDLCRFVS